MGDGWVWVLRCRGLPYSITKTDIEKFFDTSALASNAEESIQITYNEEGRPSGECYVVMSNEESYYNGLRKNNEYLKSRYIEVFESDYEDMERNLQKGGVNRLYYGGTEAPIVKLRGLPFSVTEEQVKEFFSGLKVVSLKIMRKEGGEATGEGYVKFSRQDEATAALEKHMQKIGYRYIEVFKASKREMREEKPLDSIKKPRKLGGRRPYTGGPNEHKVFMRGVPFKASQGDVIKFFSPLMPRHIELLMGEDGRPSGTAYAFFHSHEDALLAMEKDKEHMDTRYIDLFLESTPEEEQPEPIPLPTIADPLTEAQKLIAQAHGLAQQPPPTAPPTGPVQDTPGAELTAHQLMAQAHGMTGIGRHGGTQAMYPGGQPPAVYSEAQPTLATQHEFHAPAASAPTQPVRKPLMAGAARPIRTEERFAPYQRGRGQSKRGVPPSRGGRGAPARGGRGAPRGAPSRMKLMSRGAQGSDGSTRGAPSSHRGRGNVSNHTKLSGPARQPLNMMADPSHTNSGANESSDNSDNVSKVQSKPDLQSDTFTSYPGVSTASSNMMDPYSGYQGYNTQGYQGYTDPYGGYAHQTAAPYSGYTGQSYQDPYQAAAAAGYTDYSSYYPNFNSVPQ